MGPRRTLQLSLIVAAALALALALTDALSPASAMPSDEGLPPVVFAVPPAR